MAQTVKQKIQAEIRSLETQVAYLENQCRDRQIKLDAADNMIVIYKYCTEFLNTVSAVHFLRPYDSIWLESDGTYRARKTMDDRRQGYAKADKFKSIREAWEWIQEGIERGD